MYHKIIMFTVRSFLLINITIDLVLAEEEEEIQAKLDQPVQRVKLDQPVQQVQEV